MPHASIKSRIHLAIFVLVCSISSFTYQRSFADSTNTALPAVSQDSVVAVAAVSPATAPRIVDVNILCEGRGDSASIGDFIEVAVVNLGIVTYAKDSIHTRLLLNDFLQDLPLLDIFIGGDTATFVFRLLPDVEGSSGWEGFIESIGLKTVPITVGLIVNGKFLGHYGKPIYFNLVSPLWAIISLVITLALVTLLCWLGGKTMIFTDRITITAADGATVTQRGDYSLSRIQIGFWTVIVVAGFVYIWLSTGYGPDFPSSLLVLMGISGATKVVTGAMDSKDPLVTAPKPTGTKGGFLKVLADIISDGVSPTISRVQFVIWTLLFGILFLEHMFEYVKFHDFTTEQLALMGISNGVYLLMRPNEQQ